MHGILFGLTVVNGLRSIVELMATPIQNRTTFDGMDIALAGALAFATGGLWAWSKYRG